MLPRFVPCSSIRTNVALENSSAEGDISRVLGYSTRKNRGKDILNILHQLPVLDRIALRIRDEVPLIRVLPLELVKVHKANQKDMGELKEDRYACEVFTNKWGDAEAARYCLL